MKTKTTLRDNENIISILEKKKHLASKNNLTVSNNIFGNEKDVEPRYIVELIDRFFTLCEDNNRTLDDNYREKRIIYKSLKYGSFILYFILSLLLTVFSTYLQKYLGGYIVFFLRIFVCVLLSYSLFRVSRHFDLEHNHEAKRLYREISSYDDKTILKSLCDDKMIESYKLTPSDSICGVSFQIFHKDINYHVFFVIRKDVAHNFNIDIYVLLANDILSRLKSKENIKNTHRGNRTHDFTYGEHPKKYFSKDIKVKYNCSLNIGSFSESIDDFQLRTSHDDKENCYKISFWKNGKKYSLIDFDEHGRILSLGDLRHIHGYDKRGFFR